MSSGRFTVAKAIVPAAGPCWETWNASAYGAYGLSTEVTSSISATWANRPSMAWRTVGSFTPWSAWKTIWAVWGDPLPSEKASSTRLNPSVDSNPPSEKSWR